MEKEKETAAAMPLTDIFFITLRHWPWIVLSLAVCMGAAFFYLARTPDIHTRAAEIMIKDSSKGGAGIAGMGVDFGDIGLTGPSTNITNEIANLRSADLMEEVVRRMNLDINYYRDGSLHSTVAYGADLPLRIDFLGTQPSASASFQADLHKDGTVTLSDFTVDGTERTTPDITATLGDTVATPAGPLAVMPSPYHLNGASARLTVTKTPRTAARNSYASRFGVAASSDKGSVLRLTLSDESAQRADDVLTTIIDVYNENWIRDRNQVAVATSSFINERLGVIEQELGSVETDISNYKSENLIPDINAAAGQYMSREQQISLEIQALERQKELAAFVRKYLTDQANANNLLPSTNGLVGDIATQVNEYNQLMLTRNGYLEKSSETHPLIADLDRQIAQLRTSIVNTVDTHISALNVQLASLRGAHAATTGKIATSPAQAKYLLSVERQQKVKEALYLFLLQKREENELSQAFTAYNTRVLNSPGASGVPVAPNRRNILLIAFALGLAIPFIVTYLIETTNTRVRGRKDVEHLNLPFLGEIPQREGRLASSRSIASSSDKRVDKLVVKANKRDVINEAFRVLRTNVEFINTAASGDAPGARVIAITSFNPHSGKSFIAVNLGMTLALKHRRVLVVDGDMRHGSTSAYVGSPAEGLSNYLSGAIPTDAAASIIVTSADNPNLHILPVGTPPPNPTELLESPHFGQLIADLRADFDYIIIDCPPIEIVADTQIIDKYVDRTIFVVRAGLLERSMLPELEKLYQQRKYRNMAFILNGTSHTRGRYGYGHNYRYGYGYGYGYGYNYSADK